jgi:hypothetical protein
MTTDEFRIGWTQAQAATNRRTYRRLLLIILLVQVAAGATALFAPLCVTRFLHLPDAMPDAYLRIAGLLLLTKVVLSLPGYMEPVFARWPNVSIILSHFAAAILLFWLGGNFRWLAAYALIVALLLFWAYKRLLGAELMSRP